jgi:PIN domain nuclease of toxin-antitoxin system
MRLLLDTHAFIWSFAEPEKLSSKAVALPTDGDNDLILSVASVWEMQVKIRRAG